MKVWDCPVTADIWKVSPPTPSSPAQLTVGSVRSEQWCPVVWAVKFDREQTMTVSASRITTTIHGASFQKDKSGRGLAKVKNNKDWQAFFNQLQRNEVHPGSIDLVMSSLLMRLLLKPTISASRSRLLLKLPHLFPEVHPICLRPVWAWSWCLEIWGNNAPRCTLPSGGLGTGQDGMNQWQWFHVTKVRRRYGAAKNQVPEVWLYLWELTRMTSGSNC